MLDDLEKIRKIDSFDLLGTIESFPEQISEAIRLSEIPEISEFKPKNILIAGMGGSATGGEILKEWLYYRAKIPIFVNRNYSLPGFVDDNTLLIVLSYSGNTEETLSQFLEGKRRGCKIVAITSGGELGTICGEEGISCVKIPEGYQPRAAIAYLSFPIVNLIERLKIYDPGDSIEGTVETLKKLRTSLGRTVKTRNNAAKQVALMLEGKIPAIYSNYSSIANRWHIMLDENAKILGWHGAIPEMNHNEIVGWDAGHTNGTLVAILLRGVEENNRLHNRFEATKRILMRKDREVIEIWASGESTLAKMLYLVNLGDYVSVYLAILRGIDPSPVTTIEKLKKELREMDEP